MTLTPWRLKSLTARCSEMACCVPAGTDVPEPTSAILVELHADSMITEATAIAIPVFFIASPYFLIQPPTDFMSSAAPSKKPPAVPLTVPQACRTAASKNTAMTLCMDYLQNG
jgi:hypothetical protein